MVAYWLRWWRKWKTQRVWNSQTPQSVVRVRVPFTAKHILLGQINMSASTSGDSSHNRTSKSFAFAEGFSANCPPSDAVPRTGTFYACHKENPPTNSDFTTAAQRGAFPDGCQCQRRSHSIVQDVKDAHGLLKACPRRFRHISEGQLKKSHGVCRPTPRPNIKSHYSLWRYADVTMREIFTKAVYTAPAS